MKKIFLLFIVFSIIGLLAKAQSPHDFYILVKPQYDLTPLKIKRRKKGTLKVKTGEGSFTRFLRHQPVLQYQSAFPKAKTPVLKHVLFVRLADSEAIRNFYRRREIENIVSYNKHLKGDYPNDFYDKNGHPNTALQLIKAPQAWTITHGDSTLVVGVCDRSYDVNDDDLKCVIVRNIRMGGPSHQAHGTGVAGIIAGNTDNGTGIASIGYNTKLTVVSGTYALYKGLDSLSKIPGMRVINCSWSYCGIRKRINKKLDAVVKKARQRGVLIVGSAGNGSNQPCRLNEDDHNNGYRYPASFDYDNVLSVTSVGHKFPVGTDDSIYGMGAWKDCHQNIPRMGPNDPETTHTHNDAVDICAPGWFVKAPREGNVYKAITGTSIAAPFVTGTAALMFAVNRQLTPAEAKDILKCTADDIYHIKYNKQFKGELGAGRLNAYKAVLIAKLLKPTE